MPNPKLETYKNKATGTVYNYTDAAAQAALAGILDGTDIDSFEAVETALATKVDKVTGKGLSTNDYDNTEKAKVAGAFPRSEQAVLGAKNVAIGPFSSSSIEGIAYTANSDNTVGVVAGSTHAQHQVNSTPFVAPVSGMFKYLGGIANEAVVFCWDNTSNSRPYTSPSKTTAQSNNSKGKEDAIPFYMEEGHVYQLICRVGANVEVTGTFYPMIICETDTDLSYTKPAMTNKELTERFAKVSFTVPSTTGSVVKLADYPSGFNNSNAVIVNFAIDGRVGIGQFGTTYNRCFVQLSSNEIQIFNGESGNVGKTGYLILGKL